MATILYIPTVIIVTQLLSIRGWKNFGVGFYKTIGGTSLCRHYMEMHGYTAYVIKSVYTDHEACFCELCIIIATFSNCMHHYMLQNLLTATWCCHLI